MTFRVDSESLLVSQIDGVRTLILNRPDRRNALNNELLLAIQSEISKIEGDSSVRVVVLAGSDPAFCAGLDIKELRTGSLVPANWKQALRALQDLRVPLVASVNGPTSTAGLALLLSCDFAIASERANFTDDHVRLGMLSESGMSTQLVRRIGLARAKDMCMTSRTIDVDTATRWGLVNEVIPHAELSEVVGARTQMISRSDPELVKTFMKVHEIGMGLCIEDHLSLEKSAADSWHRERK